ncbi:hypothetical protein L2E82_44409 [Cichorium intybus]|uniref:Uncharacterized protein n=1 Tax=Cichorium intybus TaxID=13427 RepID=A0ACB8ZQ50_CICIN|nr:hypothetical protein L2E82_44409 [Cichorium intybus]
MEYGPMVQSDCTEKVMEITSHKKEEAHKLYQLKNLSMYRIIQEIDLRKINYKLMWLAQGDNNLEWKTNQLMCLERALGEVKPHLPMRPIPRTTGFFHLAENDAETPVNVGTDRKRCHKRLMKERMQLGYLKQVQEELLSSMNSGRRPIYGTQELNDMFLSTSKMESLVHRIQHGNNNRGEETKLFHEIRNLKETIEKYTAPTEPDPRNNWRRFDVGGSRRRLYEKQTDQHRIKILLNQIDEIKRDQKERTTKVTRLKVELDLVGKSIKSMERELEKLNLKRIKAYNCAYKHGEQKEVISSVKSSYGDYLSPMRYVKDVVVQKEDIMGLRHVFDRPGL